MTPRITSLSRIPSFTRGQSFYSTKCQAFAPNHSIYVSKSTNPYFNLSLEDWLFRNKCQEEPLLLLYRDNPCVVIGRNQNPWKEVNFRSLAQAGIPFVRRRSGGGTVYHDLGNTNYSIHLPRSSFDRKRTAQVIVRAVRSLGVDADVNDRNDICVSGFKVSGSAYKIVKGRAYHHGTMLISARLDMLGDMLRTNKETMITRGVASVRSPVRNLCDFNVKVNHESFIEAVVRSFGQEYGVEDKIQITEEDENVASIAAIHEGMDELPRWDWAFGQTPEFTYTIFREFGWGAVNAEIRCKHGIILSCFVKPTSTSHSDDIEWIDKLNQSMQGQRYGFIEGVNGDALAGHGPTQGRSQEVWRWLCEEMEK